MADPASQHEALIYAMVTLSAADSRMTDLELAKIGDIVRGLPIFDDFNPENSWQRQKPAVAFSSKKTG